MLVWHAITIILACAVALPVSVTVAFSDITVTFVTTVIALFGAMAVLVNMILCGQFRRLSRNALASRLVKTMPGQCIECNKPILTGEDHSDYHFVQDLWTSHIGTLSVHHKPECAGAGLEFLEKCSQGAGKNRMIAVHRIDGKTYSYDFLVDENRFWFRTFTPHGDPHDATIAFLRTYRRSPDVVLAVRHGAGKSNQIPILVSTKNQHIDQAAIAGKARQKAMLEAETMADRGMTVVGGNLDQETTVLSQYARATFIEFNAGSPVNACKPTVEDPKHSQPDRDHKW